MQYAIIPQLIHDRHQYGLTWPSSVENSTDSQLAAMLQRQFDEEDRLLAMEQQRVVCCRICLDKLPENSTAIDPCGHSFCRECVQGLIVSQIESRRFPVLCPTCTAEPENYLPESIGSCVLFRVVYNFRQAS